ncbi:hypothetical protein PENTCL1PPCAC_24143, partial [Pristionchus entomophagus]
RIVAVHPYASAAASAYQHAYAKHPHPDVRIYAADAFVREQFFNGQHQYPHYGTEQQTAVLGANDAVATTTRSVAGAHHQHHHTSVAGSSTAPQQLPENAIYYMGMSSGVNYISDPYMGAYADATYRPGAYTSYPSGTFYGPSHGYNQQYGTSYMHYPQPSPPNRRSRTAPSRTLPRGAGNGAPAGAPAPSGYPTAARRPRGASVDAAAYRAYLAPGKRPPAAYAAQRRSRVTSYHEGVGTLPAGYATGGPTVTDYPFHTVARPINRTPSIYQPSYTSYPPAQMHFKERAAKEADPHRYGLAWRCIVKGAQLLLGAAILGLVLGPMRSTSLVDFVTTTRTEWQGVVVGIVGTMTIVTLILLGTAVFAHKNSGWRKVDAHCSIIGLILYLLAACIESYYAACYPPNGPRLNLVCHRPEWIIATILAFINVILYVIDFILAWIAG